MATPRLDHVVAHGTPRTGLGLNLHDRYIVCADGFCLSVLAPDPAETYLLPARTLEVGFPTGRPEPWSRWRSYLEPAADEDDPTESVYRYVPVALVRDLIEAHGGEARLLPRQRS
ncbi:hypothetical protein ACFWJ4_21795 [Kitasatospora sp. NPDC127067]|uniref:hypothetical protein n=1 Tax=Kitasatospora sp. NPDC127067 TaxID=3347126 RepID=UPI00365525EA